MTEANYVSLQDFASSFGDDSEALPAWVHPHARTTVIDQLRLRYRLEEILDTVVAWQRAERLQDGIYAGPMTMGHIYRPVLDASRTLGVAVPPAICAATQSKLQGCFGTDGRAFLYLSTYFFEAATEAERAFVAGRSCGYIAAQLVTANTLYAIVVDNGGVRSIVPRSLRPVLSLALAPLSLLSRVALSRWQRASEISVDRAGLVVGQDVDGASMALLRQTLGHKPQVDKETYLEQARSRESSPGRWAELLAGAPWVHKRIRAMELFAGSQLYVDLTGRSVEDPISTEELNRRTTQILGVS